jgi:hypothetical protein
MENFERDDESKEEGSEISEEKRPKKRKGKKLSIRKSSKHFNEDQLSRLREVATLTNNLPTEREVRMLVTELNKSEAVIRQYFDRKKRYEKSKKKTKKSERQSGKHFHFQSRIQSQH